MVSLRKLTINLEMCGQHGTYGMQLFIEYIQCYYQAFGLGIVTTLLIQHYLLNKDSDERVSIRRRNNNL